MHCVEKSFEIKWKKWFYSALMCTTYHFAWLVNTKRTEIEKEIARFGSLFGFSRNRSEWSWLQMTWQRDDTIILLTFHRSANRQQNDENTNFILVCSNNWKQLLYDSCRFSFGWNEHWRSDMSIGKWYLNIYFLASLKGHRAKYLHCISDVMSWSQRH